MDLIHFLLYLFAAFLLGSAIGAERQWHQRMAGLRTNALVSTGAALFVTISRLLPTGAGSLQIAAQVVSGIGFLGAGVIMREGLSVRGLNTAATLWCSAAVGSLCGFGYLREAAIGASAVLLANIGLRPIALKIDRQPTGANGSETLYLFRLTCRSDSEGHVRALLLHAVQALPMALQALQSEDVDPAGKVEVRATLLSSGRQDALLEQIVGRLSLESGITAVSWEVVGGEAE
ncbi:MAG TPA: MgtC/SapB family protein [Terriglobales bacterium]|nr:MgtC/SapB family protein [Terriglobales bacterium]